MSIFGSKYDPLHFCDFVSCWSHFLISLIFSVLGMCAETIWIMKLTSSEFMLFVCRGIFEVQSNRRRPELHDGIQAHLSTCASPRVLEVAKKFP